MTDTVPWGCDNCNAARTTDYDLPPGWLSVIRNGKPYWFCCDSCLIAWILKQKRCSGCDVTCECC